jgi:tetratricopeptide (TPR) repeat protein
MIVRDEARHLPACLDAVRGFVDEIVIVDTGSTDGTQDLARARGARVLEWAWRDDFAAARNESLRPATGDWILVLDADETLLPGAGEALRRTVDDAPDDVVGFLIKIACPRDGDGGMVRLNWFPRLFRNLPGVHFEGIIHEQVIGSLAGHGRIEPAPVEARHAGYQLSDAEMAAKARRNLALLERQLRADPDYAPGWFQIAETQILLGRVDEGVEAYRRCLGLLETSRLTLPPGVVAVALQNLGAALIARGDRDDGIASLRAALEVDPGLAPAHVHLGSAALAAGDFAAAEASFAEALAVSAQRAEAGEYEISPWLVHLLRGCALARQTKLAEALAAFDATLALKPDHPESLWLLALTAASALDYARALEALERLGRLGRDDFPFHAQRALCLSALGRHADAADAAIHALDSQPDSAPMLALGAESFARSARPGIAATLYERLVELTPSAVAPRLALAQCRERLGDTDGMMAAYRGAVERGPEAPEVLFALGSACLRTGALDAADECLSAAVQRDPGRAEYRVNHVLCLVKRGALGAARTEVAEIAARWPALPEVARLEMLITRLAGHVERVPTAT